MATLKCKMCGGDLVFEPNSTVCECEYCGSKQTIPVVDDEKKIKLYERANKLRYNCDFDKAAGVYENIIADFPDEAEAYWGLLLCKFGIEYVDSPDGRKVPTCHRSSFDSIMDDPDFEMVMENSDSAARAVYRAEAKQIEEIRKGIIEVSGKEPPYDIFICYKETAEDGQRTLDSVLAQDIYDALTAKGYRVFFSRVTLEDKLGTEYEPYIFAALNSAKLMLAFGTSYDYYNAVWVKNEWSRYLKLMAQDKSKHLIPCYKNIDAYDMPKEFTRLQAQDLGKVGATQDLLRGIEKILGNKNRQNAQQPAAGGPNAAAILDRAYIAIEDNDRKAAKMYFDRVLDMDSRCGEAYLGLFVLENQFESREAARSAFIIGDFTEDKNWKHAKQYADTKLADELSAWENSRTERLRSEAEKARREIEIENEKRARREARNEAEKKQVREIKTHCSEAKQAVLRMLDNGQMEEQLQQSQAAYNTAGSLLGQAESAFLAMPERREVDSIRQTIDQKRYRLETLGRFRSREKRNLAEEIEQLDLCLHQKIKAINAQKQQVERLRLMADNARGELEKIMADRSEMNVIFGHTEEGKPVVWRVLGMQGNCALLVSRYAVESRPFDKASSRWETSALREWLNIVFLNKCFSDEEREKIASAQIHGGVNPAFPENDPGVVVKDKVFLLSINEAEVLFDSDEDRKCKLLDGRGCWWWLRSSGDCDNDTARVGSDGVVDRYGLLANYEFGCVRPALWLNLDA